MSDALMRRAAHYRHLERGCRRLAAIEASTDIRNHYLRMAEHYSTLAAAGEQGTLEKAKGDWPFRPVRP